jgi:lipopolysaccharide biosynthesis glycosyltransferase
MDRLFLPELLADVDKVLYLDADILVQDDVAALFATDLGDAVVAGMRSQLPLWRNAVRMVTRASLSLPPDAAWALRRRLHHSHRLDAPTFNAGVLLMDLATMRAERLTEDYLHLVEHCAFNDQDVLNVYANGRVLYLDPAWNHVPTQAWIANPRIIHWAGPVKPWGPLHVWANRRYDEVLARVTAPAEPR